MNNGIKNKLKTLIGEQVNIDYREFGITIVHPSLVKEYSYKVLRIEDEDCVVLGNER